MFIYSFGWLLQAGTKAKAQQWLERAKVPVASGLSHFWSFSLTEV